MGNVVLKPTRLPQHAPEHRPRRRKRAKFFRGLIVVVGAMILTTVAIKANDTFNVPGDSLMGGVGASVPSSRCPDDMVYVSDSKGGFCIDRYEVSAGKLCPHALPGNQFETSENLATPLCMPVSASNASPWVNIPRAQAMELCSRAGKHLPSNGEWYRAAMGTPDTSTSCVISRIGLSQAEKTGSISTCVSSSGAYDMVGNVWEWVDANVNNGVLNGITLPSEGYVAEADTDGVPLRTAPAGDEVFHQDYFFIDPQGPKGVFRGGFWSSGDKAGAYAVFAASPSTFIGGAVGFRCAK